MEPIIVAGNKNQTLENQATRKSRRTQVYFTPGDQPGLHLKFWALGSGVIELL